MQVNHRPSRTGALARQLIVTSAIAGILTLALAASASAQTGFQASVSAHNPLPKPCPGGDFVCGTADYELRARHGHSTSQTSLPPAGRVTPIKPT